MSSKANRTAYIHGFDSAALAHCDLIRRSNETMRTGHAIRDRMAEEAKRRMSHLWLKILWHYMKIMHQLIYSINTYWETTGGGVIHALPLSYHMHIGGNHQRRKTRYLSSSSDLSHKSQYQDQYIDQYINRCTSNSSYCVCNSSNI